MTLNTTPLHLCAAAAAALCFSTSALAAGIFKPGDLVLSIYGNGDNSGSYRDNQASPIVLRDVTTAGSFVAQLVLPQAGFVAANGSKNSAIAGEYGSSSEGTLQLSADGRSLTIMGYGVNAAAFNAATANASNAYGTQALAQTTSVAGGSFMPVSRVVANVRSDGSVDTSTALFNVFNGNNPRSAATVDGRSFYFAGQGTSGDTTQGVFYAADGATAATALNTATDARTASIVNGRLYVSADSKQPKSAGGSASLAVYGNTLPTSALTPTVLTGISNGITLTAGQANGVNNGKVGAAVNLSPENFFFADATTLYVADGGQPKRGGLGDGGLQKWSLVGNAWALDYTLANGLNLVANTAASGTTGLIGLTGSVVGGQVELFATNSTLGDLDPTFLYGITDALAATTLPTAEAFSVLVAAAADTNIRGVAFAPTVAAVPEPSTAAFVAVGLLALGVVTRRRSGPSGRDAAGPRA